MRIRGSFVRAAAALVAFLIHGASSAQGNVGDAVFSSQFELETAPLADLVFVIDNSASMADEIAALEPRLGNLDLSLRMNGGRLIVVSRRGNGASDVCVPPPIGPSADCSGPAQATPIFGHYDLAIGSADALCRFVAALNGNPSAPDASGQFPSGLSPLLRTKTSKMIVIFSDDAPACALATNVDGGLAAFDAALLASAGGKFGTSGARRYRFTHWGGVAYANATQPGEPHPPTTPLVTQTCPTASSTAIGYQSHARTTNAWRFSICATSDYVVSILYLLEDLISNG